MTRFIKDILILLLEFLDDWDARRIARDEELLRLQRENTQLRRDTESLRSALDHELDAAIVRDLLRSGL